MFIPHFSPLNKIGNDVKTSKFGQVQESHRSLQTKTTQIAISRELLLRECQHLPSALIKCLLDAVPPFPQLCA